MFQDNLRRIYHPDDLPDFERLLPVYETLFCVVRRLQPRTIVEIGCRRGYSAWTMFQAVPGATIISIDKDGDEIAENTHCGMKGAWRHAREILHGYDWALWIADSHTLDKLPPADLVYIDGDHTQAGCNADLELADTCTDLILVDDYDSHFEGGAQHVRAAVNAFCARKGYRGT